jgi:single-stranded DNA-binding protein
MDLNLVVLVGALATAPELREFESGARLARLLVTVRAHEPRARTDVIPVTHWDPDRTVLELQRGDRVWISGTNQRRFWREGEGRHSRLEVVAHYVAKTPIDLADAES